MRATFFTCLSTVAWPWSRNVKNSAAPKADTLTGRWTAVYSSLNICLKLNFNSPYVFSERNYDYITGLLNLFIIAYCGNCAHLDDIFCPFPTSPHSVGYLSLAIFVSVHNIQHLGGAIMLLSLSSTQKVEVGTLTIRWLVFICTVEVV